MRLLLDSLKSLTLLLLCAILAPVAYEAWHERATFESNVRRVSALIGRTEQTIDNFKEASETWKQASKEQSLATTQTMYNVSAAAEQLSGFISKTDTSVNSVLLPGLSNSIMQQNASMLQIEEDLRVSLKEMNKATLQLQATLATAEGVLADPSIKVSLEKLAESANNTSEATRHLAAITADGEKTADYYTKRLTTPQGFVKTFVQAVLQLGSQARILLAK